MMRICVFGAGASGGYVAAKLALAGHDVAVVARGAHLEAIAANGLILKADGESTAIPMRAVGRASELEPQEAIFIGVKATSLKHVAAEISPLLTSKTIVVFPQNGIPWWYSRGLTADKPLPPKIPNFALAEDLFRIMSEEQVAAGFIYSANEVEKPGVIKNTSPGRNRVDIAPIGQIESEPLKTFRRYLIEAGIGSNHLRDAREAVWQKLLINMGGSLIGLATGNVSSISRNDRALSEIFFRLVAEGLAISAAHGFPLHDRVDPKQMLQLIPDHKASILQDYKQKRPMEIGEIVLAPQAFARAANVPTPSLDVLAAVVVRLARDRGLYPSS